MIICYILEPLLLTRLPHLRFWESHFFLFFPFLLFLLYLTKQRNHKWKNLKDLTFVIEGNGRWLVVDRWIKRENHDGVFKRRISWWNKKQGEGIEREK